MTRFHWTSEPFGYALRDAKGYARALITTPGAGEFYWQILASGLPDAGPYTTREEAAEHLKHMCVRLDHLPVMSEFGELPGGKRCAA